MKNKLQTTHAESIARMQSEETKAAVESINSLAAKMQAIGDNIKCEIVQVVQYGLQMGFYFQVATGRDQLEFFLYEKLPGLDERASFGLAQRAVSLAGRYTVDHVFTDKEAHDEARLLFTELGVTEKPQRSQAGIDAGKNYGERIPVEFNKLNGFLEKMLKDCPLAESPPDLLETLIAQSEYPAQINAQSKELLSKLIKE